MNTEEFSNRFDTLLNSYAHTMHIGDEQSPFDVVLDEYEKSLFLTASQRELVQAYYSGRNSTDAAFEEKEEIREALDTLVKTVTPAVLTNVPDSLKNLFQGNQIFTFYSIPDNLLYIIFEEVKFSSYISGCMKGASALVVPSTHDELWHRLKNPFRGTSKSRVLRVNASENVVELISDYPIGSYLLRYVEEPKPIILTDLREDLAIEGISVRTECQLPSILHDLILENAVKKALQSKSISLRGEASNRS